MSEPLTPPDCDLRGMPFMPLDVVRLMDCDLFALSTGDEFKAAVALWCKSWLQVPAASLPDDPRILAHLSGAGPRWKRVAEMALRGWVRCSDGRLYHPVIAEKAKAAWQERLSFRERSRKGNEARWGAKKDAQSDPSSIPEGSPKDAGSDPKGEGEGEREGKKKGSLRSPSAREVGDGFEDWWRAYPRKVGKDGAAKAYAAAVKRGASPADMLGGVRRQRWPAEERFIPHPATWLNQGRWQDDPGAAAPPEQPRAGKPMFPDWMFEGAADPDFIDSTAEVIQ